MLEAPKLQEKFILKLTSKHLTTLQLLQRHSVDTGGLEYSPLFADTKRATIPWEGIFLLIPSAKSVHSLDRIAFSVEDHGAKNPDPKWFGPFMETYPNPNGTNPIGIGEVQYIRNGKCYSVALFPEQGVWVPRLIPRAVTYGTSWWWLAQLS
ncbi:MAG TPA: hypothetical protein VEA59_03065 [Patescibacteria group bacterium]|nr:hypothetical protein [Patescibacteria group bacterium]